MQNSGVYFAFLYVSGKVCGQYNIITEGRQMHGNMNYMVQSAENAVTAAGT